MSRAVALSFEDVAVGDELPALVRGPLTSTHVMRWSAAIENWHRIHYDQPFAVGHDGLPGLLINGSFKQHLLVAAKDGPQCRALLGNLPEGGNV